MQQARRGLARVRPATGGGDPATTAALASAPASLRELGSPYHFAPGLIDYGQYLMRADNDEAAAAVVGEAHDIADRLRCQPLLGARRWPALAKARIQAAMMAPGLDGSAAARGVIR